MNPIDPYRESTIAWLETFVIGMNLCPFAAKPWQRDQIRIEVCTDNSLQAQATFFLTELNALIQAPAQDVSTSILVFATGLEVFDDYLDLLDLAQQMLEEAGLEGIIQLASFHPDYRFEGEPDAAPSHFTNRSPYPMLHLIREEEVEAALAVYPDPESIPENNIQKMESIGVEKLNRLLSQCLDAKHVR